MVEPIFVPSKEMVAQSQWTSFEHFVRQRTGEDLPHAAALYAFSVVEYRRFWSLFLEWSAIHAEGSIEPVCVGDHCESALFFPELLLNYTANLLTPLALDDAQWPAITACNERGERECFTRGELRHKVLTTATELRTLGLQAGDHVVAIASNTAEAIVACLACVGLGATWSAVAPDLGLEAMLDRFEQLSPKLIFYNGSYRHSGRIRDIRAKLTSLIAALGSVQAIVQLTHGEPLQVDIARPVRHESLPALLGQPSTAAGITLATLPLFPWNHPLFILFSSGTTGRPKCIVHGTGGTLIEHLKEHRLHGDLKHGDKLFFHTACSWMMWNWQLSALAAGAEIVVYDGSASHPHEAALWEVVSREKVTVFGTSPSYLQLTRQAGVVPKHRFDLSKLRALLSTGSVLPDMYFPWVRDCVKAIPLQSISGGTDILGCFLLGHPNLPVYSGELQSVSLGLDVRALPSDGLNHTPIAPDATSIGELVCVNPFPSRPLGFYGDSDGHRFHKAYFSQNPPLWTHGDLIELTSRGTGRVHGRSDGVLNIRGVRIGPAEIYRALQTVAEVTEAIAVEQGAPAEPGGSRLVLLVVLQPGLYLDIALNIRIKKELAERCSPLHVPRVIAQVDEIPATHNGKRSERAARDAVNGNPIANLSALRNPDSIRAIEEHPLLTLSSSNSKPPERPSVNTVGATRDQVEQRVSRAWEQVFGMPVSSHENFFDLGGDSLRGVQLLTQIEEEFGRRLPMSSLLSSAITITRMADLLASGASGSTSPLTSLKPSGNRAPVYWIPGGGGLSVVAFRDVSLRLGDHPVYGLEARIENGMTPDVETKAANYVREIRSFQPRGPYALLGFSLGSWVAYEMALQLWAQGEQVDLLGLFDAPLPLSLSPVKQMVMLAQRMRYHANNIRKLPYQEAVPYVRDTVSFSIKRTREILREMAWVDFESIVSPSHGPPTAFDQLDLHNRQLVATYRKRPLAPYPGKITLFLAKKTSVSGLSEELDPRLGWRKYAQGGAEVHRVNGSHLSMLEPAHVDHLAQILRVCLDARK